MQRGWESEIGRARPRIEMVGGDFLSRPRTCMGCSGWEWVSASELWYCVPTCRRNTVASVSEQLKFIQTNAEYFLYDPPISFLRITGAFALTKFNHNEQGSIIEKINHSSDKEEMEEPISF